MPWPEEKYEYGHWLGDGCKEYHGTDKALGEYPPIHYIRAQWELAIQRKKWLGPITDYGGTPWTNVDGGMDAQFELKNRAIPWIGALLAEIDRLRVFDTTETIKKVSQNADRILASYRT